MGVRLPSVIGSQTQEKGSNLPGPWKLRGMDIGKSLICTGQHPPSLVERSSGVKPRTNRGLPACLPACRVRGPQLHRVGTHAWPLLVHAV